MTSPVPVLCLSQLSVERYTTGVLTPGEGVALLLMHALQSCQLLVHLGQTLSQSRLRIRRGKCRVRLSLLPSSFLSRFALSRAHVIGDGAAYDFLDSRLKWVGFASHRRC